ncbi:ROK family protein [Actinotalea fermentans]|uniref:Sugar kinase n=1 Tax=Actinotalea fermentans TaxID=43671 RepID=A0A511YZS5_9CELL|nr:ROK family protein [Actinotalea fermentans]GEN80695.1 sugar kinase [Actinotalea fermentans]
MTLADAVLYAGWTATPPPPDAPASWIDLRRASTDGAGPLVGVDVGGTKVHGAAWARDGAALSEAAASTEPSGGLAAVDQIAALATGLGRGRRPSAVVLGAAGIPQPDGTLAHAPNLPGWDALDVPAALSARLGAPVVIENDVALAAWGEHLWGGEADLAFIALGTGIGVGIVQGGRLLRGATGGAGEVFDLPLVTGSAVPGARTLEDVASGPGLQREYAARAGAADGGAGAGGGGAGGADAGAGRSGALAATRDVLARAQDDPAAEEAVTAVAAAVAHLVVSIRCLLDPRIIVLGGGLGSRTEIVDAVRRQLGAGAHRPVDVRVSRLGPRAATVGALGLAHARATARL